MISHYSFGNIIINDLTYTKDVIIFSGRVFSPWWRKEGHVLHIEDLNEVISTGVQELIIGTGYNGIMRVPSHVIEYLEEKNISSVVKKTQDAVELYNKRAAAHSIAAALHLTC
jgi:hypothetical protein